jgi:hypothetical protein
MQSVRCRSDRIFQHGRQGIGFDSSKDRKRPYTDPAKVDIFPDNPEYVLEKYQPPR